MPLPRQMFVDGTWVDAADGAVLDSFDPATGDVLASFAAATAVDVDLAVRAARTAFDSGRWGHEVSARERARVLQRMAEIVRDRSEELAVLEVRDCGKPFVDARADIDEAAFMLDYYAGWATKIEGDIPPVGPQALSLIVREPVGVCALIVPWNYPLLMAVQKVAPALAAGCTVVLKPAEQTPLTALELARVAQAAGLPDGVLNVVTGLGPVTGEALVTHAMVDKVSFTGSRDVGRRIMRNCADQLKRVTLELGGKSPNIVFADADLEAAVAGSGAGIFGNQGEVCSAGSRILVHASIYDDVLEGLAGVAADVKLGSGLDPDTTMGPLVSAAQRDRVEGYVRLGSEEGARVAFSGARPVDPRLSAGYFVPPTIFEVTSNSLRISREEIFGPVAVVSPFRDEAEVIAMANDTEYGLAAAVWTRDLGTALRVTRRIRAGVVWVNDSQPAPSEAMWGGFKQSGIGRELGKYALDSYLESKQIYLRIDEAQDR
jgi:acyl-CoA reductase-like NAD-dependent aldehyde dehydrogenase